MVCTGSLQTPREVSFTAPSQLLLMAIAITKNKSLNFCSWCHNVQLGSRDLHTVPPAVFCTSSSEGNMEDMLRGPRIICRWAELFFLSCPPDLVRQCWLLGIHLVKCSMCRHTVGTSVHNTCSHNYELFALLSRSAGTAKDLALCC